MAALAIVRRDLLRLVRNPGRTALLFALPLAMAAIFTIVFGGGGGGAGDITIRVLVYDEDDSLLSRLIQGAGGDSRMDERLELVAVGEEGYAMMDAGEAAALVHLPAGFTDAFLAGRPTTVDVVKNPAQRFLPQVVEEGVGIGAVILSQASRVFRPELEQIRTLTRSEAFPADLAVAALSTGINQKLRNLDRFLLPPIVRLESHTGAEGASDAGGRARDILAVVLPGLTMMGILFLAQAATRDILRDRESGALRHLLTAPLSANDFLTGKCLSVLVITGIGFALLVTVGALAGVDWGPPHAVVAIVIASSVAASGTMIVIMSLVGSERQGDALTTIIIIVWSLLGGAFVPLSQMPSFMQPVARTSLVFWSTDAFSTLIVADGALADVLVNIVVLAGVGLALLAAGAVILKRKMAAGAV